MKRLVLLLYFALISSNASANCLNPAGVPGEIIFNGTHNVPQYCDASDRWIAMAGSESMPTLSSCPNVGDRCNDGSIFVGTKDYGFGTERLYLSEEYIRADWKTSSGVDDIQPDSTSDGRANRKNIINYNPSEFEAFEACESSKYHGHEDWYLPAQEEFLLLHDNVASINATAQTELRAEYYWTSTEVSNSNGRLIRPTSGLVTSNNKNASLYWARCIRRQNMQYSQVVPNGLIGHWRLDETSGTTAYDSSGNDNDGAMLGGLSGSASVQSGRVGRALSFDGDDYIDTGLDPVFPAPGEFTFATWFKRNAFSSLPGVADDDEGIYGQNTCDGGNNYTRVEIDADASTCPLNSLDIIIRDSASSSDQFCSNAIINDTEWHHLAIVFDGSDDAYVYIDGRLDNSLGSPPNATAGFDFTSGGAGHFFLIGGSTDCSGGANQMLNGALDDFRIYNRALDEDEIAEIFAARDGIRYNGIQRTYEYFDGNRFVSMTPEWADVTNGLVGHWKLDEKADTTIADSSGEGNNGTFSSAAHSSLSDITVSGPQATGFDFKRQRVGFSVPYDASLNTTNITIASWVRFNLDNSVNRILTRSNDYQFEIRPTNGTIFLKLEGGVNTPLTYPGTFEEGRWYHIAGTFDDATDTIEIFVDGVSLGTTTNTESYGQTTSNLQISENGPRSAGGIDDLRIYNRVLSAAEITDIYNIGSPIDSSTALPQGCPNIGDICDDGSVYAGLSPDGNVPMFTTSTDTADTYWKNDAFAGDYVETFVTNTNTGATNTLAIFALDADSGDVGFQPHRASSACYELIAGGANDWYLPSQNELDILYDSRYAIGNFETVGGGYSTAYWSSTETSNFAARARYFVDGVSTAISKRQALKVRCVRKGPAPRCANPYGLEGQMIYNSTHDVVQFCDGARWIAVGKYSP